MIHHQSYNPSLQANQLEEFFHLANLIGHDQEALLRGETQTSYFFVPNLKRAQELACRANKQQRELRQKTFFDAIKYRSRLGQGMHDRGEAAVFANEVPPESDHHGHGNHFPLRMKAISVLTMRVPEEQQWDVTTNREIWKIDDLEELYVLVNIGHLILEKNSSLIIRGNVLSLCCQRLSKIQPGEVRPYDIGILPTPYSQDNRGGPHNGSNGAHGSNGRDGEDGENLSLQNSLLGPMLATQPEKIRRNGTDGTDGQDGTNGVSGRNGGPAKIAEITIRSLDQPLRVLAQAGKGGHGGNGGNGGNGGKGGAGGKGAKTFMQDIPDGLDGIGGKGGNGGNGGHGGNGGIASNVYINVPDEFENLVLVHGPDSEGGLAGSGGKGGFAGSDKALNGINGKNGRTGKSRPAAAIFVNEKRRINHQYGTT